MPKLSAIVDIQQLLSAYCHTVDRGSASEVAALFAVDAILKPYFDEHYEVHGRAEVERWYAHYHANFRAGVRHLKHMLMSPLISVTGDNTASGVSYLLASAVSNDTDEGFFVTGTYHDTFVCVDGTWLFEVRQIDVEATAPQGAVIETFPALNFPRSR
jgi:hypothetical protein